LDNESIQKSLGVFKLLYTQLSFSSANMFPGL